MFYISEIDHRIYKNGELISDRASKFNITENFLYQSIFIDKTIVLVFICTGNYKSKKILEQVDLMKVELNWFTQFAPYISYEEEDVIDNYPLGYFYFPELWEIRNNQYLLVLYYIH